MKFSASLRRTISCPRVLVIGAIGAIVVFVGCGVSQHARHGDFRPANTNVVNNDSAKPALITLGKYENLFEVIHNANGNVLVDFYADWCGPCKRQSAVLHDLETTASQYGALIVKVNVDQHQQLAEQFDVASLPTLVLIKNQSVLERRRGLASRDQVNRLLAQ